MSDKNTDRPSIAEKVRFWEEQDKINQALIPRVIEMHEMVIDFQKRTDNISGQIAAAEARVIQDMKKQVQSQIDQKLLGARFAAYGALALAALASILALYQWIA
ncbi:MAG: hypothetical protein F4Y00_03700 [Bacteroidetes bacterium SB0662_bin_6]|nr:hypothetical protein [Bacteroidetes bacterium SB0668_bin_1]MYE04059.1 hypothetical protein [Bacteroidetes bacterium SB0662_bin_6]